MTMKYEVFKDRVVPTGSEPPVASFGQAEDAVDYVLFRAFRPPNFIPASAAAESLEKDGAYGTMFWCAKKVANKSLKTSRSMDDLADRLTYIRKVRGLTRDDVCRSLALQGMKTNAKHYGCFERGERMPSMKSLTALCKVLSVSADYLLGID